MSTTHQTMLEKKIARLQKMLEAAPDSTMTALALAEAHLQQGRLLEALAVYQDLARRCRIADVHLGMASIYAQQGAVAQAFQELGNLICLQPDNVEARLLAEDLNAAHTAPASLRQVLQAAPSSRAVARCRERLKTQLALLQMERAQLERNAELAPGQPVLAYYAAQAGLRCRRMEERLRRLTGLEARVRNRPKVRAEVQNLAASRGLDAAALFDREGRLVEMAGSLSASAAQLGHWVKEAWDLLEDYARSPKDWMLECEQGAVAFSVVDPQHVLLAVGCKGANLGALRLSTEKARRTLRQICAHDF